MKRILSLFLIFAYMFFLFPVKASAQTLGDFKRELDALEKKEKATKAELNLTKKQIENLSNEINSIYVELENIIKETTQKEKEIVELHKKIKKTDIEIKKIMSAHQISNGDSFYLEYLFGATTITDFIIRYSVTEQLTKYNNDLIKEMNKNIEDNKRIQNELAKKEVVLKAKQVVLREKERTLKHSTEELSDVYIDILDEIKNTREVIKMYEAAGCKEYENLNTCAVKMLPSDTKFSLPLMTGYVTSNFTLGIRTVEDANGRILVRGKHLAVDMSNNEGTGSKVYAAANGKVVFSARINSGPPNNLCEYICIHHNINGIGYTSCYAHFSKRLVSVGDIVSRNTVIGLMGSTGISSGPHVHFEIGKGLKYTNSWAGNINPRTVMAIPPLWATWSNRNQ